MSVLLQEQTPLPPLPPMFPPFQETFPPELAIIAGLAVIFGGIILIIVARAVARRLEGKAGSELRSEIDGLHQRVAELEQVEQRLAELENRMEFSERLLTQQRDALPERGNRT